MAIQNRRGNESDFDPNKMLPGEWATATDTEKVWMCFKTGKVRRMATYEDMVENIGEATEEIKTEFTAGVKSATEAAAGAANTANKAAETASNASNTANAAAETAMNAAKKAEAAAGGDISEKTVSFEEVETYSKPTSGSKISSIIANLVTGISQLLSGLANKIDSSKILSAEEWGAAISERGYLADAKDVKDSLAQLNTNIGKHGTYDKLLSYSGTEQTNYTVSDMSKYRYLYTAEQYADGVSVYRSVFIPVELFRSSCNTGYNSWLTTDRFQLRWISKTQLQATRVSGTTGRALTVYGVY